MKLQTIPLVFLACSNASAFVVRQTSTRSTTHLNLEDWVANLIDGELYRQGHKADFEKEWMEKNRGAVMYHMQSSSNENFVEVQAEDFRMHAKDKRLAQEHPEQYCADRCITTGNCDIYEDFFHLSPDEVLNFCTDCVLGDGEEPCDIPDGFYENGLQP